MFQNILFYNIFIYLCLQLSEMTKLKPLPDLVQLDVAGNPLADLSHSRLYIIFHLRTVEILDGRSVSEVERKQSHDRFALGEWSKSVVWDVRFMPKVGQIGTRWNKFEIF